MLITSPHHRQFSAPPKRKAHTRQGTSAASQSLPSEAFESSKNRLTLGTVALMGLSLLSVTGCTSPPQQTEQVLQTSPSELELTNCLQEELSSVRVVVMDDFWEAETRTTHGESVESELTRLHQTQGEFANLSVERVQMSLHTGSPKDLQAELQDHFLGRMQRDAAALRGVLSQGRSRAVVHQSQGSSQSRVVDQLYYKALREPEFRAQLQAQLGLEVGSARDKEAKRELLSSLVVEAGSVASSEQAKAAREELRAVQQELHEAGYIHVISAGNQGYLGRDMARLGVPVPESFFNNELASEHSIIVGASDGAHRVASLASPNVGAHLAADGVKRPLRVDGKKELYSGSSYAAPQVSSRILSMLRSEPGLSRDQILERLQSQARPVKGAENYLGAGVLNASLACFVTTR